jgi:hypothetical protein
MKYPKLIVASGAALLFAVSAPIAWGQTRPVTGSAIEVDDAATTHDSASAMDQHVSHEITQAWSEGKDASGAAAFQENGEIALGEGKQQQARQYFEKALANLGAIEGPTVGQTIAVAHAPVPNNESASMMDQEVSRKIRQAWSEGKDASGAAAFHENGKIALTKGNEQEAKGFFRSALNELNTLNAVPESEASNRTLR